MFVDDDKSSETTNTPENDDTKTIRDWREKLDNYRLAQAERRLNFLRPKSEVDLKERLYVANEFINNIAKIPENLPIRFHGTHCYELEDVLNSGKLSSGLDREGIKTSFNSEGEISVTTPSTIQTTIGDYEYVLAARNKGREISKAGYIDIADESIPLGCVFVLMPESFEEAQLAEQEQFLMNNTDLKGNKMLRLLVSSEFKPTVIELLKKYGYDPNKCSTFEEFASFLEYLRADVEEKFPYVKTYIPTSQTGEGIKLEL